MNVKDCLEQGLLVKAKPDLAKARSSLEMAQHKLEIAETESGHGIYESAVISAYTSMFHSARALLFKDGFKERSHFALYVYVNEQYGWKLERKYLSELNALRLQRHDLMYGLEKNPEAQESNADSAVQMASGFLAAVKGIVEKE